MVRAKPLDPVPGLPGYFWLGETEEVPEVDTVDEFVDLILSVSDFSRCPEGDAALAATRGKVIGQGHGVVVGFIGNDEPSPDLWCVFPD